MKRGLLWGLLAATLLCLGCATEGATRGASDPGAASAHPSHTFPVMTWSEVEAAVDAGAVLVDARSAKGFQKGHITGAINVPWRDAEAYGALPGDRATALIFYCGGPRCSASARAAQQAHVLGFAQVAEYKGGYPEWVASQPSP